MRRPPVTRIDPAPPVPADGRRVRRGVRHEVTSRTVLRVVVVTAVTVALLWLLVQLAHVVLLLFSAFLLTAALDPVVTWLVARGLSRPLAVAVLLLLLLAATAGVVLLVVPPLITQGTAFVAHAPGYLDRAQHLVRANPALVARVRHAVQTESAKAGVLATGLLKVGVSLVQGVSDFLIILVMTVYLLVDGERTFRWDASPRHP